MTVPSFLGAQTPSGAVDSSGALAQSGAVAPAGYATDTQQAQAAQQIQDAIAAAKNQQNQDQQQAPKDTSKGWSWNPLQDIGQIWHDVETHTVAPVFHAANWLFTNLVKRPYTTAMIYGANQENMAEQGRGNLSIMQGSEWGRAWDASNDISPGQATILAVNNNPLRLMQAQYASQHDPAEQMLSHIDSVDPQFAADRKAKQADPASGLHSVDPYDPAVVGQFFHNPTAPNAVGNKIASGGFDAAFDMKADPTLYLGKGIKVLRGIKSAPISTLDSDAQKLDKLNAPASQAFNDWSVGKTIAQIAEHPVVKGSYAAPNPYRYQLAALLTSAKNADEVSQIRQVMANVSPAVNNALNNAGKIQSSDKALDTLSQTAPNLAVQISNLIMPAETMEKFALTAASASEKEEWLRKASQLKAKGAQSDINMDPGRARDILQLRGAAPGGRTTTNRVLNRISEIKGNLKYQNTRDIDSPSFMHTALYNFPIRIYQGIVDRPEGLINHNDDQAVEYARSWLNKSGVLSNDDKVEMTQRYAQATPAQRMQVWDSIENRVYNTVGDRYGIGPDTMKKILTTTRTRQQAYIAAARSKAYGSVELDGEEHALLPTPDSEVVLHPKYLNQLERGAVPMANLKNLENALEAANRDGGSVISALRNKSQASQELAANLLDKVYGVWKPLSLMTGHRAYNHIGDDWLRGLAKLGATTTIQHAAEGTANFLRNNYARVTKNALMRNMEHSHNIATSAAKADFDGLVAQRKWQVANPGLWEEGDRISPLMLQQSKNQFSFLKNMELDFIQPKHRIGTGSFKIPGSSEDWTEAFGGPNSDWVRLITSSHAAWNSMVDDSFTRMHSSLTSVRTRDYGTINATDDVARHTAAYMHYVRNQMIPDPVGGRIIQGQDLNQVEQWLKYSNAGQAHQRALHIGDAHDWVQSIAEDVKRMLPNDIMREDAASGKFSPETIERGLPNAGDRPPVPTNIGSRLYGGDQTVNFLKKTTENLMRITGTLPDDIMVRHPIFNSLYKQHLTNIVQSHIASFGNAVLDEGTRNQYIKNAMLTARKDMQNLVYDVSRFNDLGHTLRFVSPFFNAWFNAMSSWSKLFIENPELLARTYQAKRALWNSPFAVDTTTGKHADVNTPWDNTAFVVHMPKALSGALGGLTTIPIDAKTLVSPTYIDSVGNPGFGPLVSIPVNAIVKQDPALMNNGTVRSILNNMVDKNSMMQLMPSGVRDVGTLAQMMFGNPKDVPQHANTVWSIYQEQMYDYLNGTRATKPNWDDINTQASYLTVLDLFANRLMPLGFKPAPAHQMLINQYRMMQAQDPKNARQNFYDKWGKAAMVFTQSLNTDPSGIPATVGASVAAKKYKDILSQYPELGSVVVGPEGNGNFDDMAYQWQVANGLRSRLTPEAAATQSNVNIGWAEYGQIRAAVQAQIDAAHLPSLNDPRARAMKAQITNWVSDKGDPKGQNYNPDWYANYTSFNQNAYQNRITGLLTIAQDPAMLANPVRSDMRSLQKYSQLRDYTYAQLQTRPNKSMKAIGNSNIQEYYDTQVAQMIQDDTKFAQLYDRYLSKDDFKEPV